jgi:uncharacterized membrane protein
LLATLAVIVPLALATVAALFWLWPAERVSSGEQTRLQQFTGSITKIELQPCPEPPPDEQAPPGEQRPPDPATCGEATIALTTGPHAGRTITTSLPSGPGSQIFGEGDDVVLLYSTGQTIDERYQISDHDRSTPLWIFGAAFALAVIAFGRLRGLMALAGLAITFVVLLMFIIPAILGGEQPLLIAIVGASAIMLSVLYLTHGFTVTTSVAVVGTLASLTLTGVLSVLAIEAAHLTGLTDESSFYLDMSYQINTQGLLLASIIIGSLGVLDDVTVTQSVTVAELAHANPAYSFGQLYRAASRVGRAHIASVINTIILAYAGASLPLLLLISVGNEPLGTVLTNPVLTQEIVRSVVGTLGLISAVPITTALAALAATRRDDSDQPSARARHRRPDQPIAADSGTIPR